MIYFLYHIPSPETVSNSWLEREIYANFETEASISRLVNHFQQRVPDLVPLNIVNKSWVTEIGNHPVFNYTYAFGQLTESIFPSYLLETRGYRYFGAPPLGIWLSANKPHASSLMKASGYLVPKERLLVSEIEKKEAEDLCRYFAPAQFLVLKPAYEESSIGLRLIECEPDRIMETVNNVYHCLHAPLLLQEYIEGEDVTVPIIGCKEAICLPAVVLKRDKEKISGPFVFEADSKATKTDVRYTSMEGYPSEIRKTAHEMAKHAFRITHQRDYARLDFRLTTSGECYFLEINANPQLGLDKASFAVSSAAIHLEVCDVFDMIIHDEPKLAAQHFFEEEL
jgi:D-alanine-D-alanine ligase